MGEIFKQDLSKIDNHPGMIFLYDGLLNGQMSQEVQWKVKYEDSLIQPIRTVIDVNMGKYASGNR